MSNGTCRLQVLHYARGYCLQNVRIVSTAVKMVKRNLQEILARLDSEPLRPPKLLDRNHWLQLHLPHYLFNYTPTNSNQIILYKFKTRIKTVIITMSNNNNQTRTENIRIEVGVEAQPDRESPSEVARQTRYQNRLHVAFLFVLCFIIYWSLILSKII